MKHDIAVVIGRFQPFHIAHKKILEKAFEIAHEVVIVIGSHKAARSARNPWTSSERIEMIKRSLTEEEKSKVKFITVRDYLYNDNIWINEIQHKVSVVAGSKHKSIVLVGHKKDESSYYLSIFPQWKHHEVETQMDISATDIRHTLFTMENIDILSKVPKEVREYLSSWCLTEEYLILREEYRYIREYKKLWSVAPYPVTFVTTDAVVTYAGHVLVIKRGGQPGVGKLALPGGFLGMNELIFDSCIRELREETLLELSKEDLSKFLKSSHVFDHPKRSSRGRTITHAFHFDVRDAEWPCVSGADDAAEAFWLPISEVYANETEFFEDHRDIILYFLNR